MHDLMTNEELSISIIEYLPQPLGEAFELFSGTLGFLQWGFYCLDS